MTRSWSHSALRLTGVTLGGTGTPTGGLPIVLSETRGLPASQGGRRELAHTTSGPHGEWTLRAAAGGSRRLQVQCGKSTVTVAEHVKPTLTMRAHGAPEGVLRFAGKLAGPHAPVRGTVMVQVHGPHGWQEVGNPVHPHHDHWHLTYHTSPRLAGYKFRFRAVSPSTPWTGRTVSHARRLRIR